MFKLVNKVVIYHKGKFHVEIVVVNRSKCHFGPSSAEKSSTFFIIPDSRLMTSDAIWTNDALP